MQNKVGCFQQEIFLNQNTIRKFICPIDFGVCREPVLDPCGHSFGKECINSWVNKKKTCPLTNVEYPENLAFTENYAIKEFLNDLQIRCPHFESCPWEGVLENLESHLQKNCGMELVTCLNQKCTMKILRKEIEAHIKNECLYAEIECVFKPRGCNFKMQRCLWVNHLADSHHHELKEILENYDKNEIHLGECKEQISAKQIEIDQLRQTHIAKDEYYEILHENNALKSKNADLEKEIMELEFKVKQTCLKLLEKEKEAKMIESRLSTIKEESENPQMTKSNAGGFFTPPDNNPKAFIKSQTLPEEPNQNKKLNNTDFNTNLYSYPPQNLYYNPITGKDLTMKVQQYTPSVVPPEQKTQPQDPTIYDFSAHENSINYILLFTVNDLKKYLASCALDNQIKIWDVNTFQLVKQLQGHFASVSCLFYNKDFYNLISAGYDMTIRIWNVNSWECLKILDGRAKIRCLLPCSKPSEFLSGHLDNKIRFWTSDKGEYVHQTIATLEGEITALESIETQENYEILAGDSKGFIYLIQDPKKSKTSFFNSFFSKILKSQKCHDTKILCLRFVKERGAFLSCGLSDNKLKIRDKSSFQLVTEVSICSFGYCINDIKYDAGAGLIIIGTSDEKVVSIGAGDWNVKKSYEKEGFGVNNVEIDLRSGCIYSCGAYKDKKDGKYKYIIRVRRV